MKNLTYLTLTLLKLFEEYAARKQAKFLKQMVNVPEFHKHEEHTYQSLIFDIVQIEDGSKAGDAGVYCDLKMQNIIGFDPEGNYQNPYVVEHSFYTDTLEYMEDAYNRYSSAKGFVVPDTNVTYNITCETADNKTQKLCSVSVPYSVVKSKYLETFPISLPKDIEDCVINTMDFMSNHVYKKCIDALIKDAEKETTKKLSTKKQMQHETVLVEK